MCGGLAFLRGRSRPSQTKVAVEAERPEGGTLGFKVKTIGRLRSDRETSAVWPMFGDSRVRGGIFYTTPSIAIASV